MTRFTGTTARALALAIAAALAACGPNPDPPTPPDSGTTDDEFDGGTKPTCTPEGNAVDSFLPTCPTDLSDGGGSSTDVDGGTTDCTVTGCDADHVCNQQTGTCDLKPVDPVFAERANFFDVEADGHYYAVINGYNFELDMAVGSDDTTTDPYYRRGDCASGWLLSDFEVPSYVCLDPMTGNLTFEGSTTHLTGRLWACNCNGFEDATSARICRDLNGSQENCLDPSGHAVMFKAEASITGEDTFNGSYFQTEATARSRH